MKVLRAVRLVWLRLVGSSRVRACVRPALWLLVGFGAAAAVGLWLGAHGASRPVAALAAVGVYLPVWAAVAVAARRRELRALPVAGVERRSLV